MISNATNAYEKVGMESDVAGADPHYLILLLYQGALAAVARAKTQIQNKDMEAKGKAITHAVNIIDSGLNAALDKNVGGELAENLSGLYTYMCQRLFQASASNDIGLLDEVTRLLSGLKDAWETIRPEVTGNAHMHGADTHKNNSQTYGRA